AQAPGGAAEEAPRHEADGPPLPQRRGGVNPMASDPRAYTAADIEVVTGCEHIRRRPGMYIGDTGRSGLHSLVFMLLEPGLERLREAEVWLHADGSATVAANGTAVDPAALGRMMTQVGAMCRASHWLSYCGVSALSEWCVAETRFGGRRFEQRYE